MRQKKHLLLFLMVAATSGCTLVNNVQNNIAKLDAAKADFMKSCEAESARCSGSNGWHEPTCANFIADSRGRSCEQMWKSHISETLKKK